MGGVHSLTHSALVEGVNRMDDLISRQDAIDALMNDSDWADAIPTIKSLPSADRPTVDK